MDEKEKWIVEKIKRRLQRKGDKIVFAYIVAGIIMLAGFLAPLIWSATLYRNHQKLDYKDPMETMSWGLSMGIFTGAAIGIITIYGLLILWGEIRNYRGRREDTLLIKLAEQCGEMEPNDETSPADALTEHRKT